MNLLAVILVGLSSPLFAESEAATASLKRFAELEKQSESITKESSEKEGLQFLVSRKAKETEAGVISRRRCGII